jgi:hypothetical protein
MAVGFTEKQAEYGERQLWLARVFGPLPLAFFATFAREFCSSAFFVSLFA